jgi:hypothetical protein
MGSPITFDTAVVFLYLGSTTRITHVLGKYKGHVLQYQSYGKILLLVEYAQEEPV